MIPVSEGRTQINEAVDYLSRYHPQTLTDLRETTRLGDLLQPSIVMGSRKRKGDAAIGDAAREADADGDRIPPMLREEALVIGRVLPLIAESCATGAEYVRVHRRRKLLFAFWGDLTTTVSGSAVIAILAKGPAHLAFLPAVISFFGSLSALASRYYSLAFNNGARADPDRVLRRLIEVEFDAQRTAGELGLHLRFNAEASMIRKLVNTGNQIAREVNVDLAPYIRR
jgi:hypothetical protein